MDTSITSRESKAHFGLPWVRTWDNRGKCYMDREFNACQTPHSMYPSIFNRFLVIQAVKSKGRHFSTFLHILASPGYAPVTIAINVTWIEREFNACQTPRSMFPSIFNHFWDIARYRWRVTGFWQFSWANERFFNHILLSPGYAPGTIAVNVTRLERGFRAGCTNVT